MAKHKKRDHLSRVIVLDIETDPFFPGRVPKPFAVGIYDGSGFRHWWGADCIAHAAAYLNEFPDDTICYAHNGGKFDWHYFYPYMAEDLKIVNGRIAECKIGPVTCRDSFMILPLPLSAHAKDVVEYSKFESECREHFRDEITDYLRSDCLYLYEWVCKFIDRFGMRLTLAGTAFDVMKKQFGYQIETTGESYDERIRPYYYGGRVQAFETGKIHGPLVYLDVNSAYPFAMLSEHPQGDSYIEKLKLPDYAGGWFADIEAVSDGVLPLRGDEKLFYPRDTRAQRFHATGWEIAAGLETGTLRIKKVHRVYKYAKTRNFTDYILTQYTDRKKAKAEGDKDTDIFCKLLMNSAYGKFGQDSREFEEYKLLEMGEGERDGFEWKSDVAGEFELHARKSYMKKADYLALTPEQRRGCRRPSFYNVATAASITGFVRAMIWRAVCAADRPIYCDTDSIICQGYNGTLGNELGQWKLEAAVNTAWIGGRKMYALDTPDGWKVATKGFRADGPTLAANIEAGTEFEWASMAPAFNIKRGAARFVQRKISPEKSGQKFFENS